MAEMSETRDQNENDLMEALINACYQGRVDILSKLFDKEVNIPTEYIVKKINKRFTGAITKTQSKSINLDSSYLGDTPLHLCCKLGNEDCVRFLLRTGVKKLPLNVFNSNNLLPYDCAKTDSLRSCFIQEAVQQVIKYLFSSEYF